MASIPKVPRVTVIPRVPKVICAKSTSENKTIQKNEAIAKIPAPKGGD